jgi:NAD(P)-dependent dehydrogenase (short-subunit alcohol dehydrogenase family)
MDCGLRGKVAMISGGGRGIGLAITELFAQEGANTSICSRSDRTVTEAAKAIEARYGVRCLPVAGDLTEQGAIDRWVHKVREVFGKVDILVNNASATRGGSFLGLTADDVDEGLALKLFGYLNVSRAVIPLMQAQGRGSIVNIIGVTGLQPVSGSVVGSVAGAALLGFNKALAEELIGSGIRVNAVNPGVTATHRRTATLDALKRIGMSAADAEAASVKAVPIGRPATPEEVANVAVFVASDRARYLVGTAINVDGGYVRGI